MAASKKKSIFDQNFGLRLFMKKKNSSVKKNLRLITKKYIQEACVKIWDWSVQPFPRNLGYRLRKHRFEKNAFKVF